MSQNASPRDLDTSTGKRTRNAADKENRPPASSASSTSSSSDEDSSDSDEYPPKKRPKTRTRGRKRPSEDSTHHWAPLQKQLRTDPLVGHGRHFGRTIRTFCRVQTLISSGLATTMQLELDRISESDLSRSELLYLKLYRELLALSPGLEERLNTTSEQDMIYVANMITKGISSARSDDTKSLKSAVVDWITPYRQYLNPPLQRNVKTDRGFYHYRTGELLCPVNFNWKDEMIRRDLRSGALVPSGDMWPRFIYKNYDYNPQDAWEGLLRSNLLVQAYKHVFTSPSSVYASNGVSKATRSSNARLHGMTCVTIPSIAYIATQVRFALSSSSTFSRTDLDPDEEIEVTELLKWWNQCIFPIQVKDSRSISEDSVISKIKERRRLINQGAWPPPRAIPPRTARKAITEQLQSPMVDGDTDGGVRPEADGLEEVANNNPHGSTINESDASQSSA
ncbi:hypothetical protein NMY22_g8865 [Coprinellus aureogranulatus]|nr:hypothetical protein NMY22_g8865 [Coprinellus aureogranulatus]